MAGGGAASPHLGTHVDNALEPKLSTDGGLEGTEWYQYDGNKGRGGQRLRSSRKQQRQKNAPDAQAEQDNTELG